jgi:hypothetical protein
MFIVLFDVNSFLSCLRYSQNDDKNNNISSKENTKNTKSFFEIEYTNKFNELLVVRHTNSNKAPRMTGSEELYRDLFFLSRERSLSRQRSQSVNESQSNNKIQHHFIDLINQTLRDRENTVQVTQT